MVASNALAWFHPPPFARSSRMRQNMDPYGPVAAEYSVKFCFSPYIFHARLTSYTCEVLLVAPAVSLCIKSQVVPNSNSAAPHCEGVTGFFFSHHSLLFFLEHHVEVGRWLGLSPNGSMTLQFPCISSNSSIRVSAPSPLLPCFAIMSSNCCGRKCRSLSYVSLSDPCYIYADASASAKDHHNSA